MVEYVDGRAVFSLFSQACSAYVELSLLLESFVGLL